MFSKGKKLRVDQNGDVKTICSVKYLEYLKLWKRNNEKQKQSSSNILEATFRIVKNALQDVQVMSKHFLIQKRCLQIALYRRSEWQFSLELGPVWAPLCPGCVVWANPRWASGLWLYILASSTPFKYGSLTVQRGVYFTQTIKGLIQRNKIVEGQCLKPVLSGLEKWFRS